MKLLPAVICSGLAKGCIDEDQQRRDRGGCKGRFSERSSKNGKQIEKTREENQEKRGNSVASTGAGHAGESICHDTGSKFGAVWRVADQFGQQVIDAIAHRGETRFR